MFLSLPSGERCRVLLREYEGVWVISFDAPSLPILLSREEFERAERIPPPEDFIRASTGKCSEAEQRRFEILRPALEEERCITDPEFRRRTFRELEESSGVSVRTLKNLYCTYLATGSFLKRKPRECLARPEFDDAIRRHYFSAKKNSLQAAYELFILENYTNRAGTLESDIPTWSSFRQYYYRVWGKNRRKEISRFGLGNYRRNERMLFGSAMAFRDSIGCFQIDETQGDLYLVSKWDRNEVIGRPYLYLAVDTATQLICGMYAGMEAGENAVMSCLANAVQDKTAFCSEFGIEVSPEEWPCHSLPSELLTDKGGEFTGSRLSELCVAYGVEIQTLPPFRPEQKPIVEMCMDLVQNSYKSMLRGKGVIEADAQERWAADYKKQAVLTLEEYKAIVVHCILNLNRGRVLKNLGHLPFGAPNTPAGLWRWFEEQGKSELLDADYEEIYIRSLPRASVKISRKGILFHNLRYLPPAEVEIGKTAEIAFDPQNTGQVFLLGEEKEILPCSLAESSERYRGYTAEEIGKIREQEREERKEAQKAELESRVRMRSEIRKILAEAEKQKGKRK